MTKALTAVLVALALSTGIARATTEDSPGWSCVDAGNHVCGPASDDYSHTPGCYDDGGVLIALWPCHVVINPDGSSDIYEGR